MSWWRALGITYNDEARDVNEIRSNWFRIRRFFHDAQNSSCPQNMQSKLGEVERELDAIISHLLNEKAEFVLCLEESDNALPPCYDYILRGMMEENSNEYSLSSEHNFGEESGKLLIMTICNYAKHDIPEGSRALMLRFLTRLFRDVDANTGVRSLMHYSNDYVAAPLYDCLSRIFNTMNPSNKGNFTNKENEGRGSKSLQRDRREFVSLLRVLASQIENIPSFASFFVTRPSHIKSSKTSTTESSIRPMPKLLIIEGLLPFITDHVVDLSPEDRIQTVQNALAGVLHIARTLDPVVQGFLMGDDGNRVMQIVSTELCCTLVTASKIPSSENKEFPLQVAYILEIISFLDALVLTSPLLSQEWHIRRNVFAKTFLEETVCVLVKCTDVQVYSNIMNILSLLLQRQVVHSRDLLNELEDAIFGISASSMTTEGVEPKIKEGSDTSSMIESLFGTYILPRVNDVSVMASLATLTFLDVAASHLPEAFLSKVLMIPEAFTIPKSCFPDDVTKWESATLESSINIKKDYCPSSLVPILDVNRYFPTVIREDNGLCGSNNSVFCDNIIKRMLLIESFMKNSDLKKRQPSIVENVYSSVSTELIVGEKSVISDSVENKNPFVIEALATCPVVQILCGKLRSLMENSIDINMGVTGALITLCLLPDSRVPYSLLDPIKGALGIELQRLSDKIELVIVEDKQHCMEHNLKESGGKLMTSKLTLFKHYVQSCSFNNSDDMYDTDGREAHSDVPQGHEVHDYHYTDPYICDVVSFTHKTSKKNVANKRDSAVSLVGKSGTAGFIHKVFNSDNQTKNIVEACVCLEGFRYEISSVVAQVEVSLSLMELSC
eukprot:Tbor_TRINITY_DN4331_c0_g1::TRINITY_DN4331_c0_g1_i1::g.7738::m.7738